MKLRNSQIIEIYKALMVITVKENKYKAKTVFNLSRNIKVTRVIVEELEEIRNETIAKYRKPGMTNLEGEDAFNFSKEFSEVLKSESEVDIRQVDIKDLDLDTNNVDISGGLSVLLGTVIIGEL